MLPDDGDDAVLDAFRILDSVSIPKGAVRPSEDEFHYTCTNCIQLNRNNEELLNSDDLVI